MTTAGHPPFPYFYAESPSRSAFSEYTNNRKAKPRTNFILLFFLRARPIGRKANNRTKHGPEANNLERTR
jgi:hypothetical protein